MSNFLNALATTFAKVEGLGDYYFLFPTRRAGRFFLNALSEKISGSVLMPRIDTLGHWVERCSKAALVGDQEPVFILYKAYCQLLEAKGLESPTFEKFRHWGTMLAADFQDIDRNLVEADKVFVNVRDLKNISTDYLTEQQRKIIKRYWGESVLNNMAAPHQDVERFWKTAIKEGANDKSVSRKYLRLWEVLPQLYRQLHDALHKTHTATQGMMLREVAENIEPEKVLSEMGIKKLVFAGFDNLSLSEIAIMSKLQKANAAYFYWDIPHNLERISPNSGYPMIKQLAEQFSEPEEFRLAPNGRVQMPSIEITGVPGHHAQTRAAAVTLRAWGADKTVIPTTDNAINTAVVLPEADLFLPMIHAVPSNFKKINVTVGVPIRQTPVGTLMQQVVRLQTHARRKSDTHAVTYFYEDVKLLLANPLVRTYAEAEADKLLKQINERHQFRINPADLVDLDKLRPLFRDPDTDPGLQDDPRGAVYAYISGVTDFMRRADDANPTGRHKLTELFIDTYRDATKHLCANLAGHGVHIGNTTLLKMIQQSMMSYEVPLSGEPVEGLQIMGIRETRALDFENIMVLSMNENVFPQKAYRRSIIPDLLRRAWGMSTSQQTDRVMAYRFFRLVAHANHVALFYDTRADSLRNPRMSRYIYQLIYMPGAAKPRHTTMQFPLTSSPKRMVGIKRDDRVRKNLSTFLQPDGKALSPSALKTYMACPLHFYLSYIEGLNLDDEVTDSIDSAMFGTILHDAFDRLYKDITGEVTAEKLTQLVNNPAKINLYLKQAYNLRFRKMSGEDINAEVPPSAKILLQVMGKMVINTLTAEASSNRPFKILGTEVPIKTAWEVIPGRQINFKGYIDRLDRLDKETLRMVDYKTGSDDLSAADINELFTHKANKNTSAILQLLTYAHLYNAQHGTDLKVMPAVYKLRDTEPGNTPLTIAKKPLLDHHDFSDEFLDLMKNLLSEIFDFDGNDTTGFPMADDPTACRFCKMRMLCQTTPPTW